jgi:hypothetical protein
MSMVPQITIRSACSAPACFSASRIAIKVAGRSAYLIHRADDFIQRGARAELEHRLGLLLGIHPELGTTTVWPSDKRVRLADLGSSVMVTVRLPWVTAAGEPDVLTDHDGAGARVDDDLCHGLAHVHFQVFQDGQVVHTLAWIQRCRDPNRAAIEA